MLKADLSSAKVAFLLDFDDMLKRAKETPEFKEKVDKNSPKFDPNLARRYWTRATKSRLAKLTPKKLDIDSDPTPSTSKSKDNKGTVTSGHKKNTEPTSDKMDKWKKQKSQENQN